MPAGTKHLVLDLFAGIGGASYALGEQEHQEHHIFFETDQFCRAVLGERIASGNIFGSLSRGQDQSGLSGSVGWLTDDRFRNLKSLVSSPDLASVLVISGSPCVGFTKIKKGNIGVEDRESVKIWMAVAIVAFLRANTELIIHHLFENVDMLEHHKAAISSVMGSQPTLIEAGRLCGCRRPRLYWSSLPVEPITGIGIEPTTCLENGWIPAWELGNSKQDHPRFGTFLRPFEPHRPKECKNVPYPRLPLSSYTWKGLVVNSAASQHEREEIRCMLTHAASAKGDIQDAASERFEAHLKIADFIHLHGGERVLRPLTPSEREACLGFPPGASGSESASPWHRMATLGNTFAVPVLAHLLRSWRERRAIREPTAGPSLYEENEIIEALRGGNRR